MTDVKREGRGSLPRLPAPIPLTEAVRGFLAGSFIKGLSWNLAAYALARVTVLIVGMVVAGSLGIAPFAQLTLFILTINLLSAFSDLGVSTATTRATIEARTEPQALPRLVGGIHLTLPAWAIAFFVVTRLSEVGDWSAQALTLLAVGGLASAWQSISAAMLTGLDRQSAIFAGNVVFAILQILFAGLAVGFGDVRWAMGGMVLAYAAQAALQLALACNSLSLPLRAWLKPSALAMRAAAGMVGVMALTSLIASLLPFAIGNHLAKSDSSGVALAIFGASTALFGLVLAVPSRVAMLYFVRQVGHHFDAAGRWAMMRQDLRAIALTVLAAAAALVGLVAIMPLLAPRWGSAVAAQVTILIAYSALALPAAAIQLLGSRFVAVGRPQPWLAITIVQTVAAFVALETLEVESAWLPTVVVGVGYGCALVCSAWAYPRVVEAAT